MATVPPPSGGYELPSFEEAARLVLDIPAEIFDMHAAAFDEMTAALHDIGERLRVLMDRLQAELQGVAGDAAGEVGALLRSEMAAVEAAISGDGAALYRAGDALAAAQRAMRDLAVQRAQALASTPTPEVVAQFDDRAHQILVGLAQALQQVITSLSPIPGLATPGRGAGGQAPHFLPPNDASTVPAVDGGATGDGASDPGTQPPPGQSETAGPPPVGALFTAWFRPPAGEGVDQSGVDQSGVDQSGVDQSGVDQSGVTDTGAAWTAGFGDQAPPTAALGRGTGQTGTDTAGTPQGGTGVVLPPAVLRSAGSFLTGSGEFTPPAQSGETDTTRTGKHQDARGENPDESVPAPSFLPGALGALGRQPGNDSGRPRTTAATGEHPTARVPEFSAPPPPVVEQSALAELPAPVSRQVTGLGAFDTGGASERYRPSFTPPGATQGASSFTSVHPSTPHIPEPVTGTAGSSGSGMPPPMMPPIGGLGGMGGLPGRVEPDRTREVSLLDDSGAWDDDVGGAPAVLGRR